MCQPSLIQRPADALIPTGGVHGTAGVLLASPAPDSACPQFGQNCRSFATWVPQLWQNIKEVSLLGYAQFAAPVHSHSGRHRLTNTWSRILPSRLEES